MGINLIINTIFSLGLFINALLFIPQAIKIIKTKSSISLSKITYIGFLCTQAAAIAYGINHLDYILIFGYALSLITCGFVTILLFIYK